MSLLERHLRALARCVSDLSVVCIDVGDRGAGLPALPAELPPHILLQVRRRSGSVSERLASFLAETKDPVLAFAADTIIDPRLFDFALGLDRPFVARDRGLALLRLDPGCAGGLPAATSVTSLGDALLRGRKIGELQQSEFPDFIRGLRRNLPFYMLPVRDAAEREDAERFMFRANYKGSTDFFTRHVYPALVWAMVRPLARFRVHPNWITMLNVLLGVLAIPAFAAGEYLAGFACAYTMSVLDSVDGKLARLTFTDSRLGTLLDHGLDLIHPPFWYLAWAWAAAGADFGHPVMAAAAMLVAVYILDRLCLKIYSVSFRRGLHAHAAFDSWIRTFIARRNMNLPLFTVGVLAGLELEAFYLIVAWQLATLVWHACRVAWILLIEPTVAAGEAQTTGAA